MCAGYQSGTKGGCKFDEGSPLVCYHGKSHRWYLQGLFSYSSTSCSSEATRYSIFTRISMYTDAIKRTVVKPPPTESSTTKVATTKVATFLKVTTQKPRTTGVSPLKPITMLATTTSSLIPSIYTHKTNPTASSANAVQKQGNQ